MIYKRKLRPDHKHIKYFELYIKNNAELSKRFKCAGDVTRIYILKRSDKLM